MARGCGCIFSIYQNEDDIMGFNKKTLTSIAVQLCIALIIAVYTAVKQGFLLAGEVYLNCRYISDGCFVSAVLFIGLGGLFWISATGFFDIFSYGFKSLLVLFTPLKRTNEHPHYYEYKCEKDAKREGKPITYTTLIVGLVMLVVSLVCLALYYNFMPAQ